MIKVLWKILFILLIPSIVFGQACDFYVALGNGNDGAAGTSAGTAWNSPVPVNALSAGPSASNPTVVCYLSGNTFVYTNNNQQLKPKSNQTHRCEGSCATTNGNIGNIPALNGNGIYHTVNGNALVLVENSNNVIIDGLRIINAANFGLQIRTSNDFVLKNSVFTNNTRVSITPSSATTASQRLVFENNFVYDTAKQPNNCSNAINTKSFYNTFVNVASDSGFECGNSDNPGGLHELAFNIVRSNIGNGRALHVLAVDATNGQSPQSARNYLIHHTVVFDTDQYGAGSFIHTAVPTNSATADRLLENHTWEYMTIARVNAAGVTGNAGFQYRDNRTTTDNKDMSQLRIRNSAVISTGNSPGIGMRDSIPLLENTNNAFESGETFVGTTEGSNRQTISNGSFRNFSPTVDGGGNPINATNPATRNFNPVAGSALLNNATDPQKHIGALQPITFSAGACTIETATPNKMCCTGNSQFDWNTAYVNGVCNYASIPITVVSAPARTSTGCTLQSTAGEFCIDFSGNAVTQGQGPITVNFPAGVLAAGQIGSSYDPFMLRHENIAYTNFSVVNNVGANPSFGSLRQISYRFRKTTVAGEVFNNRSTVLNGLVNTAVELGRGGKYQIAMEVDCTGGNPCQTTSFAPFGCDGSCETPGNWYLLGTSYAGKMLKRSNSNNVVSLDNTTQSLTSCGTFVNGRFIDAAASSFPNFNLGSGQCTKFVVVFEINPAASYGQELKINMQRSDGTDLTSSVDAVITVGRPRVIR